ncbi:MAG TPA: hypothetical protein VKW08_10365 [Xanthobacteraceae bacterium]|nr:hypothetical protein [Xanthobacteraceae bacterium]
MKRGAAPLRRLLRDKEFDAATITNMSKAFVQACHAVDLKEQSATARVLARTIVNAARGGARTRAAMYFLAVRKFRALA